MKTVALGGAFQKIHKGHIRLFKEAKKLGRLVVIVASDETVKMKKPLLRSQKERIDIVKKTGIPDEVVAGGADRIETLLRLNPDIIVLGYDQNDWVSPLIERYGLKAKVVRMERFGDESTTPVVFYLHGGMVFSDEGKYEKWLESLEVDPFEKWAEWTEKLKSLPYVVAPRFPCPDNAKYRHWKIMFEKYMEKMKGRKIVFVGYSLGSSFFAKYALENGIPENITSAILVSLPIDDAGGEEIGDFKPESLEKLDRESIHILISEDDPFNPPEQRKEIKKLKKADIRVLRGMNGHFNIGEFPELFSLLEDELKKASKKQGATLR